MSRKPIQVRANLSKRPPPPEPVVEESEESDEEDSDDEEEEEEPKKNKWVKPLAIAALIAGAVILLAIAVYILIINKTPAQPTPATEQSAEKPPPAQQPAPTPAPALTSSQQQAVRQRMLDEAKAVSAAAKPSPTEPKKSVTFKELVATTTNVNTNSTVNTVAVNVADTEVDEEDLNLVANDDPEYITMVEELEEPAPTPPPKVAKKRGRPARQPQPSA